MTGYFHYVKIFNVGTLKESAGSLIPRIAKTNISAAGRLENATKLIHINRMENQPVIKRVMKVGSLFKLASTTNINIRRVAYPPFRVASRKL
jgi:hypothetical protein